MENPTITNLDKYMDVVYTVTVSKQTYTRSMRFVFSGGTMQMKNSPRTPPPPNTPLFFEGPLLSPETRERIRRSAPVQLGLAIGVRLLAKVMGGTLSVSLGSRKLRR